MKTKTDILIIGGGSIGVCSAHYLSEAGKDVVLVDKTDICAGSSYGNAGLIVPSHSIPLAAPGVIGKALKWMFDPESPFYIKPRLDLELAKWLWEFQAACTPARMQPSLAVLRDLNLASVQLFTEIAAIEGLDFGFEKKGSLMVYKTEQGLEDGIIEAGILSEKGIQTEILDPGDLRRLDPMANYRASGAVYYPQDAHLVPARFVRELARHVIENSANVRIHPSTEVIGFKGRNRRIQTVVTTRGEFSANEVVLAGGAWSPAIASELGLKLPIQPAKGYSVTFERPDRCPEVPASLAESKVAVTPMGDMLRFGGTLELAGMDLSINKRRVAAILNAVPRYLPDLNPNNLKHIETWRGLRPCTPDGLPFLGRSRTYKNLTVAAGHAMIGVSLGPITGKLVSQVVTGQTPAIDLGPLRVDRFENN